MVIKTAISICDFMINRYFITTKLLNEITPKFKKSALAIDSENAKLLMEVNETTHNDLQLLHSYQILNIQNTYGEAILNSSAMVSCS